MLASATLSRGKPCIRLVQAAPPGGKPAVVLLVAIVQSEDIYHLSQRLLAQGFRLTQINAFGGLLGTGSVALLLGVDAARLPVALETIAATCQARTDVANAAPWLGAVGMAPGTMLAPMEVLVGGAVVFGLPVQRFLQLPATPAASEGERAVTMTDLEPISEPMAQLGAVLPSSDAAAATKLVVAIVHSDDANQVVDALLSAGHRLTRLNTAGGFLRRGNATLLIGARARDVDEVLALIQANVRPRTEPNPPQAGMPMYGATVFVLDASHFLRF